MSMGSGGGGGGGGNTNKFDPPDWTRFQFPDVVQAATTLYSQPRQDYYGQLIAGINDSQQQGMQYLSNLSGNNDPATAALMRNAQITASGGFENPYALLQTQVGENPYLNTSSYGNFDPHNNFIGGQTNVNTNPYMGMSPMYQQMKQNAMQDVVDNYQNAIKPGIDSAFNHAGAFGAGGYNASVSQAQNNLAKNLARTSADMDVGQWDRSGDYAQQYNNMRSQYQNADLNRNTAAQQQWLQFMQGANAGDLGRNAGLYESAINRGVEAQVGDINRASQAWDAERNRAMGLFNPLMGMHQQNVNDARNLIGIGDIQRGYTQDLLNSQYNDWQRVMNYPGQNIDNYLSVLSRASGNYGQNTSMVPNGGYQANPFATAVGVGALGAGLYSGWGG